MATWAELTPEQRDQYEAWEKDLRSFHADFHKLIARGNNIKTFYDAEISAVLVALDDNTLVPNSSGLQGASSLDSDAEAVALQSHINDLLTTFDTVGHKQLRAKAAGINALTNG